MDYVACLKMVTTRADMGKKATRREGHGNSITIKDFGDQFSGNALDGKSHSPHVPSDGRDDELECEH
jgi:hypothetical protein